MLSEYMSTVIKVENLSKKFKLTRGQSSGYRTLRESLSGGLGRFFSHKEPAKLSIENQNQARDFWALSDVSFSVQQGERIGIIGRNGAGKSTLLKIISRITLPTLGSIRLKGRVASLLEVGTGFHSELTGRENIFLNGAILGMKRADIHRRFDEIVQFAEVEKFLDTPVKHYSSGMYVRLAFAVAAHLDTDILIVDEVLAVGDAAFQKKCLGKMQNVTSNGRTVLFVSHNTQAISTLTEKCLVLSEGRREFFGETAQALNHYLTPLSNVPVYIGSISENQPSITRVEINTSDGNGIQQHNAPMQLEITIDTPYEMEQAALSFRIVNNLGQHVVYGWRFDSEKPLCRSAGRHTLTCNFPQLRLYPGRYQVIVHLHEKSGHKTRVELDEICPFEVVMHGVEHQYGWPENLCNYIETFEWQESFNHIL